MSLSALQGVLPDKHYNEIKALNERISAHRSTSAEKQSYYDGENRIKDLGVAIPPSMRNLDISLDWCAKAVDSVSSRLILQGFVAPETDLNELGLDEILTENNFLVESSSMFTSSLLHGCSFLMVYQGNEAFGEPKTIIRPIPATHATGRWSANSRKLSSALVILDEDNGSPTRLFYATPTELINLSYLNREWVVETTENPLGKTPVFPVRYNPSLSQPFGRSRITKAMLSLTQQALRTMLRLEVSSEFFSSPQRYLLGAEPEMFMDEEGNMVNEWSLMMGRVMSLPSREEDGENVEVGQFASASPEPHLATLRQLTNNFAGASSLPASSLGFTSQANPNSAESLKAATEELLVVCRDSQRTFDDGLQDAIITALELHNGFEVPEDIRSITTLWVDPSTPSLSAQADAVTKLVGSGVLETPYDVVLEKLGFSSAEIIRIKSDRAKDQAPSKLAEVLQGRSTPTAEKGTTEQDQAAVLKTKADALGLLRRAGVDAESAAELVGLQGVKFIPGNPITIRAEEV